MKEKWLICICIILSFVLLAGCSGNFFSRMGDKPGTRSAKKYYVQADEALSEEELEALRRALFTRARVLEPEVLTEYGRDSKGDYISVEFSSGKPDSYYKLLEEHPKLHFFLNYGTDSEEEVLVDTRLESADMYAYGDNNNEQFFLNLVFNEEKKEELTKVTADHIGERMAVCLDDWMLCEPVITTKITDGRVTIADMEKNQLKEIQVLLLGSGQDYELKLNP